MLCRKNSTKTCSGSAPVYLNVYDLTSINGYAYWLGLGVYHSGVQVHGVEYAFGAHDYPTTGIFEGEPKKCDGFTFRKAILMGWTEMSRTEVRKVMVELAEKYRGNAYNLIAKNCNHFCNDACVRLTGNPIPSWVNRLARIGKGLWCYCIIPVSLNSTKVHNDRIEDKVCESEGDKKKLRSRSNRFTSSSNSISSSSAAATSSSRSRCSLPPSSPLLLGPTSS